ncbi:DUF5723 family protein [Maribacter sp. 2307ULW6-5]|uniref:DUF5723 family protein n=1 Tax=Maribacter sp. 2307ULW6-5 TaxID=3386275 RepID=UPI0039BD0B9A
MRGQCRPLLVLFLLATVLSVGQNKPLLYDFLEVPQALMLNPGMQTDYKWYAGLPLLSGISGHAGSNGVALNDIFANDGVDFNLKFRERMLNALDPNDAFLGNAQLEWLSGGFRSADPNIFYSFGAYLEMDHIAYWPQDLASFFVDGNAGQVGRRYDLGHLKARGTVMNVMHFGINKKMGRKLTVGARGKFYAGILDLNATRNRGFFVNVPGQNNTLATTISADMNLRTSGLNDIRAAEDGPGLASTMIRRTFFGGDLGLGLDLGFSHALGDRTVVTGSLLDLGFIYHRGDVERYSLKGAATVEGIELDAIEDFIDLDRDFWQELVDEVEAKVPFQTKRTGYLTFRPTRLYGSIRHGFGQMVGSARQNCDCDIMGAAASGRLPKYRNSLGAQLFVINRPRGPQAALTGFYQRRLGHVLSLKTTYTVDRFSYTNIGLGLSLQAGPVHFYALANNLLSYRNLAASHYASFQLGLNIISWGGR